MPVTNYYTIDGSILAEATGAVRTDYLTDALGSVTATVDSAGSILNTYRYKPYGEQLAKTGAKADPKFTWVGTLGYRQTGRKHSDTYVRARHYGTSFDLFSTLDPIYINNKYFSGYTYTKQNPATFTDPSGLYPTIATNCHEKYKRQIGRCTRNLCDALHDIRKAAKIKQCLVNYGFGKSTAIGCMTQWCSSGKIDCIYCDDTVDKVKVACPFVCGNSIEYYHVTGPVQAFSPCRSYDNWGNNPNVPIHFCEWWYRDLPKLCPNMKWEEGLLLPPAAYAVHELLHICAECQPPQDSQGHNFRYFGAAQCILQHSGCKREDIRHWY